jgi:thiol-disulfide isomerase/thioredoxin
MVIGLGEAAPSIEGATFDGPHALVFYKVTCPTCRMAAPMFERLDAAYAGRIRGIGQDPAQVLARFAVETGMTFPSTPDLAPYVASDAYGIEHVPTVVVVDGEGRVADVVESWDRDGVNRASATLAELLGTEPSVISEPGDGFPDFRPG